LVGQRPQAKRIATPHYWGIPRGREQDSWTHRLVYVSFHALHHAFTFGYRREGSDTFRAAAWASTIAVRGRPVDELLTLGTAELATLRNAIGAALLSNAGWRQIRGSGHAQDLLKTSIWRGLRGRIVRSEERPRRSPRRNTANRLMF
jgi:hypothetical protein